MNQPDQASHSPSSRRKFLREVGMTAAAAAAVAGFAETLGAKPALAATSKSVPSIMPAARSLNVPLHELTPSAVKRVKEIRTRETPDSGSLCCVPDPNHCGGPCTPNGVFCHVCCDSNGHCGFFCISGDTSFCIH